jgi:hypothetical protein
VDLVEDHDASLIRTLASRALRQGGVLGQIPTPLDEVTAAANLAPPEPLWDGNVAELPSGLQRVVRKLRGVVLGAAALRERTIYLDRSLSEPKQRFNHGHELGHSLLPWHRAAYHGDDRFTLAPETHEQLEQEASRFAAELLFQLDGFTNMARGLPSLAGCSSGALRAVGNIPPRHDPAVCRDPPSTLRAARARQVPRPQRW